MKRQRPKTGNALLAYRRRHNVQPEKMPTPIEPTVSFVPSMEIIKGTTVTSSRKPRKTK